MGIFEQYGIKEIADVTLYAITENKYGEEIYVPLIYFDTLKVSDIEQAAEQTSARGGLGNSHQVYWDYNKEVSVRLTDALYTPASQSLTWGNYLGLKPLKLQGIWTPEKFIIKKVVVDTVPQGQADKYVKFVCPCDNIFKYYTYQVEVTRRAAALTQKNISYRNNDIKLDGQFIQDIQFYNGEFDQDKQKGELIIKNFVNFSQSYAEYSDSELISHWRFFNWSDCQGEIVSQSETIAIDGIDLAVFSNENTDNMMFLTRRYYDQNTEAWTSKLIVYKIIYKELNGLGDNNQPITKYLPLTVHLGDFYIVEDWNIGNSREETIPYNIDLNYNSIPFLDNIEKIQAKKDFKIDTNKNILAYNAFLIKDYEKKNLVCYIDPTTMRPYSPNEGELKDNIPNSYHYFKKGDYYLKKSRRQSSDSLKFLQTLVLVNQYNGLFKLAGETYIRDRIGEDQHYQIEIPRCRLQTGDGFNLSADGESNTVNMNFSVLPSYNGKLISITRYENEVKDECNEKYTRPILTQPVAPPQPKEYTIDIIYPSLVNREKNSAILCVPNDCRVADREAYVDGGSRLVLPQTEAAARAYHQKVKDGKWNELPKDLLLAAIVDVYDISKIEKYIIRSDNCTIYIKNTQQE